MALVEGINRDKLIVCSMIGLALKNGLFIAGRHTSWTATLENATFHGLPVGDYKVTVERL